MNTLPCMGTCAVHNGFTFYVMYIINPPSCIFQEGFFVIISCHSIMQVELSLLLLQYIPNSEKFRTLNPRYCDLSYPLQFLLSLVVYRRLVLSSIHLDEYS